MTENPCRDTGCKACCTNIVLYDMTRDSMESTFPDAIKIPRMHNTIHNARKINTLPEGVHYFKNPSHKKHDRVTVYVVGECPHLTTDGNCDLYGKPNRPEECVKFEYDSKECKNARLIEDHNPVAIIPIDRIK